MSNAADQIVLEARGISKRYPGALALDGVTMRIHRHQVNVLIGENGAGKSTLMRILAGVETADSGELLLEGTPIRVRSPREAAALGITIVHQELSVLPNLDISENVFAGREPVKAIALLDRETEDRRSARALASLRRPMPVRTKAAQLSLGSRQIVEIARTLDQIGLENHVVETERKTAQRQHNVVPRQGARRAAAGARRVEQENKQQ